MILRVHERFLVLFELLAEKRERKLQALVQVVDERGVLVDVLLGVVQSELNGEITTFWTRVLRVAGLLLSCIRVIM